MIARHRAIALTVMALILIGACGAPEPNGAPQAPVGSPGTPPLAAASIAPTAPATAISPPPTATPALTGPLTFQLPPELEAWVDVDGHHLYIHCTGTGSPAVILEAGYHDTAGTWSLVKPEIATFTRACAYDRAGLGQSEPGSGPEDAGHVVEELHTLLENAGLQGPYVLVGHSLGGPYVRLYAGRYREDVAGLVLVDSAHPDQFRRQAAVLPPESPGDSESVKFYRDWFASATPDPTLGPSLFEPGSLGDLPLAVLTAMDKRRADDFPEALNQQFNQIWMELQEELAQLSTDSIHLLAWDSQHFVQQDQPELVVETVRQVVEAARTGTPLTALRPSPVLEAPVPPSTLTAPVVEATGGIPSPSLEAPILGGGLPTLGTPLPLDIPAILTTLQDLPFDQFLDRSYRQLQLRDPDTLFANGLADEYGVANDRFTDRSDAYIRGTQQLETAILDLLRTYDRSALAPDQQLSYDIYEWILDDRVRGHAFTYHDYPVNPLTIWGLQNWLIDFMVSYQPIASVQDAEDYVARLSQLDTWVAQMLEGLRLREEAGVVPPRPVLEASIRQVEEHLQMRGPGAFDVEAILLYASFREKLDQVAGLDAGDREALLMAARAEIEDTFIPAFLALRDYLGHLASVAGDTPGAGRLPDGAAYYAYLLRHEAGTSLSPGEVHALGLAEVARLQAEIRAAAAELGYPGDTSLAELNERLAEESAHLSGEALLAEYRRLIARAQEAAGAAFDLYPRAGLALEPEPFGSGMAYYRPPPLDGSGPGVFYINTDLEIEAHIIPTFVYHETVPGHHLQGALARELDLPAFRRELELNAYVEGWALYAERLAWEMGLYADGPLGNLGRLQFELSRAARVVVDTGLHARGWTREEAAAYYEEATGIPTGPAAMDRYVILPGQGCGYTLGLLKILDLRQRAMDRLGERFDIKAFHNVVLGHGAMPLEILKGVVEDWIALH